MTDPVGADAGADAGADVGSDVGAQVRLAARDLVAAFGVHDVAAYFAAFAPDATFVFHSSPVVLRSRAEYEAQWAQWESEGLRVEGCASSAQHVQVLTDDVAVFTHEVSTRLAGVPEPLAERETIVFRRDGSGRWLAVHEHLSPAAVPS